MALWPACRHEILNKHKLECRVNRDVPLLMARHHPIQDRRHLWQVAGGLVSLSSSFFDNLKLIRT